jgi:hypothetical protein
MLLYVRQVECECPPGRAGKLCQLSSAPFPSRLKVGEGEDDLGVMQSDQGLSTADKGVLEFDGKRALRIPNRITKRLVELSWDDPIIRGNILESIFS